MTKFLILFLFVTFTNYSQNKNTNSTAIYIASIYKNLGNKAKNSVSINNLNESIKDKQAYFSLTFNKDESYYSIQNKMNNANDFKQKIANIFFGDDTHSYVTRNNKESVHLIEAYGEKFLIPVRNWEWSLTNKKKKIGNYVCYQATTKYTTKNSKGEFVKNVIAWYCPDINYPFGPKGFHGLPGLIIELYDSNSKYVIRELKFNITDRKINKPNKGKKVSQEEFEQIGVVMDG